MTETQLPNCARPGCGHPANWHRLDDSIGADPTDPATEFRCIGYNCETGGPAQECAASCRDYVKLLPEVAAKLADALKAGAVIVCYSRCWPCQFGQHTDQAHTWMDDEDRVHAGLSDDADLAAGRPCGCYCNEANR